ncbi:MAG: hypothetical protein FJ279_18785 [Planctomycetes bacterium]|nr:hypothetical protein [Planctomycetota bacterium]
MKPQIRKLGTIDCDLVETTPVVFKGRLYRFEYVRPKYWANRTGQSHFRFVEHDTGEASRPFAHDYHLGNVMVEHDTLYVTGTNIWDGERVDIFRSTDMANWESWNTLNLPGYGIFNTSMCRAGDRYVLMFELGKPPELVGVRFTAFFAVSDDLRRWQVLPPDHNYAKDRYTAPHALRYLDGWFYNFYLEYVRADNGFEQRVVRSRDLKRWESSPLNPVLRWSEDDRRIANPNLPPEQVRRVQTAENRNNSDIDFCEHEGRVIINYSWGNQRGNEFLAEAVFDGTLAQFLKGWFPEGSATVPVAASGTLTLLCTGR